MSGALSARELLQQTLLAKQSQADEQRGAQSDNASTAADTNTEFHASKSSLAWYYLVSGNLAVVSLVVTMMYGFQTLAWWIAVACLVVSFPALHYIFLQRLLSAKLRILLYPALAWVVSIPILIHWFF